MNIGEAERSLRQQLSGIYESSEASVIAALVLEHVSGLTATARIAKRTEELSPENSIELRIILERLQTHEPIQYITNRAPFYGMDLYVDSDVLIPRPETEELVDWIVKDVRAEGKDVFERRAAEADETRQLKILDVGTGSGCIALALKKAMPRAEVWGCDISDRALNIARRNGSLLDIRVDFQSVNFLDHAQQKHLPTVDVVVSNPPYVPLRDKHDMQPHVVRYEPHQALFVDDDDPLLFYKALAAFGLYRLYPGGILYLEIHEEMGRSVQQLLKENGYGSVEVRKDMQGKERMVKAVKG